MPSKVNMITTKLKMPSPRRNYIRREALFVKLDGIPNHRITIIKGSAGSGKTTLLTSYIHDRSSIPFKWLALDHEIDDILAFWRYFSEAVLDASTGREDISALFAAAMNRDDITSLLTALINELDEADDFAVVLDDFHTLHNINLLESIEYFIKNSPEKVHVVLATREEPQFYIGDIAISGGLLSIGEEDLRFTNEEASAFLRQTLELKLSDRELEVMSRQAEGWVGGLQLLALAPAGNSASMRDIRTLGRYAVEYLQRELLNSLPEEHQEFLVKTAELGSFDAAICDALFQRNDSAETIQTLLDKNLFLSDIGGNNPCYRYHNIFSEFLRLRFAALGEENRRAFHLSVARYYGQQGACEECIRHLLKAQAYAEAMTIIKRESADYRLWAYLSEIPLECLRTDRDLVLLRLFYIYYNDGSDKLMSLFDAYRDDMEHDDYWRVLKIAKAVLVDFDFRYEAMTANEIDAMELGDIAKAVLCVKTAVFLFMKFELREALEILDKADKLQAGTANPFIRMSILSITSGVKEELGDLEECEKLYGKIFELMNEYSLIESLTFNFHVGVTGIYLKTGRLDMAQRSLDAAVKTAGRTDVWADGGYLYNLMELRLLQGQADEAYTLMEKLLGLDFYKNMMYASGLVKYLSAIGRLTEDFAERYTAAYHACAPGFLRAEDKIAYARVLRCLGRDSEALELADTLLETLRDRKVRVMLIDALLFKFSLLSGAEAQRQRMNLLREAVYYGYGNRIISPFLLAGPDLEKPLLELIEQRGRDLSSVEKLFAGELALRLRKSRPDELLSERELEVLRHLATGETNKEIGERLYISLSTVKTHIISIYSKLQAGNRLEAVDKARSLGLIN